VLLRLVGVQALATLAATLPPRAARSATLFVLVLANATPLLALATGAWGAGDVLIAYWLENLAIGAWTLVKIATAEGADPVGTRSEGALSRVEGSSVVIRGEDGRTVTIPTLLARLGLLAFFCVHYGIFTLVHGVFTFVLAHRIGTEGHLGGYLLILLVMLASHGVSTLVHWFWRGGRHDVGMSRAMSQPYGRVVLLHLVILASAFLIVGDGDLTSAPTATGTTALLPAVGLVAVKTLLDAGLHLRAHRAGQPRAPALVGPAA
jgi:hypothetical protein